MSVLGVLLEGFDDAKHPRGFHGRWIGKPGGKVLRVFHGSASLGDAKPERGKLLSNVAQVAHDAGKSMTPAEARKVVNDAAGSPAPTPRVIPKGGSANELRGGIPRVSMAALGSRERGAAEVDAHMQAFKRGEVQRPRVRGDGRSGPIAPSSSPAPLDRHGGFKVGDHVTYETGSREAGGHGPVTFTRQPGVHAVVGLQRNGYLRVRHPKNGTTVDVHHLHATKVLKPVREAQPLVLGALLERDFSVERRRRLAKSGAAMSDGSFPIENAHDLDNAIKLAGHASNPDAAKSHIRRRAKALGLTSRLPDGW